MSKIIQLIDVCKKYDDALLPVLNNISLVIDPAETIAITGPSGSGKSTLLNILGTLDFPTSGKVLLDDIDICKLNKQDLQRFRAQQLGFIFQDHHLLPQLTARENVMLPTLAKGCLINCETVYSLLDAVGISSRAEAFPGQLSGGERQRTAIARALINAPQLLLCDEPTGNLDHAAGEMIMSLLLDVTRQRGVTVLIVTHNREYASRCQRHFELCDGQLLLQGKSAN